MSAEIVVKYKTLTAAQGLAEVVDPCLDINDIALLHERNTIACPMDQGWKGQWYLVKGDNESNLIVSGSRSLLYAKDDCNPP